MIRLKIVAFKCSWTSSQKYPLHVYLSVANAAVTPGSCVPPEEIGVGFCSKNVYKRQDEND